MADTEQISCLSSADRQTRSKAIEELGTVIGRTDARDLLRMSLFPQLGCCADSSEKNRVSALQVLGRMLKDENWSSFCVEGRVQCAWFLEFVGVRCAKQKFTGHSLITEVTGVSWAAVEEETSDHVLVQLLQCLQAVITEDIEHINLVPFEPVIVSLLSQPSPVIQRLAWLAVCKLRQSVQQSLIKPLLTLLPAMQTHSHAKSRAVGVHCLLHILFGNDKTDCSTLLQHLADTEPVLSALVTVASDKHNELCTLAVDACIDISIAFSAVHAQQHVIAEQYEQVLHQQSLIAISNPYIFPLSAINNIHHSLVAITTCIFSALQHPAFQPHVTQSLSDKLQRSKFLPAANQPVLYSLLWAPTVCEQACMYATDWKESTQLAGIRALYSLYKLYPLHQVFTSEKSLRSLARALQNHKDTQLQCLSLGNTLFSSVLTMIYQTLQETQTADPSLCRLLCLASIGLSCYTQGVPFSQQSRLRVFNAPLPTVEHDAFMYVFRLLITNSALSTNSRLKLVLAGVCNEWISPKHAFEALLLVTQKTNNEYKYIHNGSWSLCELDDDSAHILQLLCVKDHVAQDDDLDSDDEPEEAPAVEDAETAYKHCLLRFGEEILRKELAVFRQAIPSPHVAVQTLFPQPGVVEFGSCSREALEKRQLRLGGLLVKNVQTVNANTHPVLCHILLASPLAALQTILLYQLQSFLLQLLHPDSNLDTLTCVLAALLQALQPVLPYCSAAHWEIPASPEQKLVLHVLANDPNFTATLLSQQTILCVWRPGAQQEALRTNAISLLALLLSLPQQSTTAMINSYGLLPSSVFLISQVLPCTIHMAMNLLLPLLQEDSTIVRYHGAWCILLFLQRIPSVILVQQGVVLNGSYVTDSELQYWIELVSAGLNDESEKIRVLITTVLTTLFCLVYCAPDGFTYTDTADVEQFSTLSVNYQNPPLLTSNDVMDKFDQEAVLGQSVAKSLALSLHNPGPMGKAARNCLSVIVKNRRAACQEKSTLESWIHSLLSEL